MTNDSDNALPASEIRLPPIRLQSSKGCGEGSWYGFGAGDGSSGCVRAGTGTDYGADAGYGEGATGCCWRYDSGLGFGGGSGFGWTM
jgi:hypothetical protein